jgi:DNA-binding IclR family transcriptional regulator
MRIVELLNFLAANPNESFRLSEIARRVGFNKATAHGMLAALTDAEYLAYDPSRATFGLGPTVVGLAQAAVGHESKLAAFALPEMEELAARTGAHVLAQTTAADELVIIAAAGMSHEEREAQVGSRGRMVPPLGMIFHAWASDARVNVWLERMSADARERARFATLLAVIRERGFSVSADPDARDRLDFAVEQLGDSKVDGDVRDKLTELIVDIARGDQELIEILPDRSYRVRQISVPVFDAQGSVALGLLLTAFPELPGKKVSEYAREALESARRVTRLVAGGDVVTAAA